MDRSDNLVELLLRFRNAGEPQHIQRFLKLRLRDQPAGTARNGEQRNQKTNRRYAGDTELPPPFAGPELQAADQEIRHIREEYPDDNVDLKETDQAAPPLGGCNLRDVHWPQYRGAADAQTADEAEENQRRPVPRQCAA